MIPFAQIETVFLDVGNTLISIDFDWVAAELEARQISCTADALRRAEAGARPGFSQQLFVDGVPEGTDLFRMLLSVMLRGTSAAGSLPAPAFATLLTDLRAVLRPDGRASVLWRSVMPRVPEALARLQQRGLTLVVVSNSDGTAERSLEAAGLRRYFAAVIDSALVGFEKPDPRIFTCALERCGAAADRTLHIGDLYHADVSGARGAGIHALLLDPFDDWNVSDCARAPDLWAVADLFDGSTSALSPHARPDGALAKSGGERAG